MDRLGVDLPIVQAPMGGGPSTVEMAAAVQSAVQALPAVQRDVVELRQQRGLTFQQIAERLNRPLGTVLTQMRAALARISAALENYR